METAGLDYEAMESQYNPQTKKEREFEFIYKKKIKTINFCPYCRAVFAGVTLLPFVYLWRLYPHKPKPKKTHEQIMKSITRRGWIGRILPSIIWIGLGIKHLVTGMNDGMNDGTLILSIFYFTVAGGILTGHLWLPQMIRWIILHSPKWERKQKPEKIKKPREPSKIMQKIKSKHDVYCPPIFFVEEIDSEKLK